MMAEIRSRERFACYYFYYALLSSISYLGALYLTWNHLFLAALRGNIHNILNFQHYQHCRITPVLQHWAGSFNWLEISEGNLWYVSGPQSRPAPVSGRSQDKCVSVTISTLTLITICYSSPLLSSPQQTYLSVAQPLGSSSHSVGSFHFWHKQ